MRQSMSKFIKSLLTVFLFLTSYLKTVDAINPTQLKSYSEFRNYAIHWGSNQMTAELNRALNHLQMIHGNAFNPYDAQPSKLIAEMKSESYLDLNIYVNIEYDPVEWHNKTLRSISYPEAFTQNYQNEIKYPISFVSKALITEKDPYVKLFSIQEYSQRLYKDIPIKILLQAIFRENDFEILSYYIKALRNEHLYSRIPGNASAKVPKRYKEKIKNYANEAKNQSAKANALFLNLLFSDYLPVLETQTLMFLMDNEFPREFLLKVFTKYPSIHLEKFTVPFIKGYGNQFSTLLYLFEKFHSNAVILKALKTALVNRQKKHFVFHQGAILNTWQRITSRDYEGNDKVFIDWYDSRSKK